METFWHLVAKSDRCWMWTGPCRRNGTPRFRADGTMVDAHVFSYELANGPVPTFTVEGHADDVITKVLKHTCGASLCVRPDHLEPTFWG